jgi:hypothetical protein
MTKKQKQNKGRRENNSMSIKEADIKKGWAEMEMIARKSSVLPPDVDPNTADLSDLFEWGSWVAQKANLTKEDSHKLLRELRKSKK